jgi:membrane-bound lytic murein transglycosylase B
MLYTVTFSRLALAATGAVLSGTLVLAQNPAPAEATSPPSIDRAAFAAWLTDVRAEALTKGISQATVDRALDGVEAVDKVLERDRTQAEFALDLEAYLRRRLTVSTIRTARRMSTQHKSVLGRVGKAYAVDPRVVVAIWGLESNFGRFSGVRPTVPVLATLAWDGRRGDFFRQQLFDALTILDRGYIELDRLKGSWAGALGQVQFMPSSYLAWAVDFDKDGDRDVWTSMPDVFGSIGHYLQQHGWSPGPWGFAVTVADEASAKVSTVPLREEGCRAVRALSQPRSLKDWRTLGVRLKNGKAVPASAAEASMLHIDKRRYLVTANYEALLAYNCANTYALSVALLSDRLPAF